MSTVFGLEAHPLEREPRAREGHELRRAMLGQAAGADATGFSLTCFRPDSNTAFIAGPHLRQIVPLDRDLDYWEGEP